MKVFINRMSNIGCQNGMILVAANTPQEAHDAFHKDERFYYMWENWSWENPPYISDEYYKPEDWEEMPMLTANVEHPQVLAEASYKE